MRRSPHSSLERVRRACAVAAEALPWVCALGLLGSGSACDAIVGITGLAGPRNTAVTDAGFVGDYGNPDGNAETGGAGGSGAVHGPVHEGLDASQDSSSDHAGSTQTGSPSSSRGDGDDSGGHDSGGGDDSSGHDSSGHDGGDHDGGDGDDSVVDDDASVDDHRTRDGSASADAAWTDGLDSGTAGCPAVDPCPPNLPTCEQGRCIVRGPTMVAIQTLDRVFYIDSTEVTVRQYLAFLTDKGSDTTGQPPECSWNTSYRPPENQMVLIDDRPMNFVDWCDARAFCDWAGKRLCGSISGGAVSEADLLSQTKSQWFLACGGTTAQSHPSLDGTGVSAKPCQRGGTDRVTVGTTCEGSFRGLFEMEGNVAEWVDACSGSTGRGDICRAMGGSSLDLNPRCGGSMTEPRDTRYPSFGFRCCSR